MTPRIGEIVEGAGSISRPSGVTGLNELAAVAGILTKRAEPGYYPKFLGALKAYGKFIAVEGVVYSVADWSDEDLRFDIDFTSERSYNKHTPMELYYPLDPRIVREDIEDATRVWPNESNTGWLFQRGDADHMHDREIEIRSGLVAVFQPEIDKAVYAVLTATATRPSDWPIGTPWETEQTRRVKLNSLTTFRDSCIARALAGARDRYIGWYHHHPHESHLHTLIGDSIGAQLVSGSHGDIADAVGRVVNGLDTYDYETRWGRLTPKVKAEISGFSALAGGTATTIDLATKFRGIGTLTYTARSNNEAVATAVLNGTNLTVTPLVSGMATVTVRASSSPVLFVEQEFTVTVVTG